MPKKGYKQPIEQRLKSRERMMGNKYGLGYRHTPKAIKKIIEAGRGERNKNWKGDSASYRAKHNRIYRLKGKAKKCSVCGAEDRQIQWCNINHKYSGNVEDYIQMCVPCHRRYDFKKFGMGRIGSNQYVKR
jgi:hypothetical protein